MALTGIFALVCSCDILNNNGDEDETGSIYGTWVLDNLTIEASSSVAGSGSQNNSVIDFTNTTPCYLIIDELVATAQMGWDVELSGYTFNAEQKTITFNRSLSVPDDGKAMVLVGLYDITELTANKLVLRQPDFNIDIPGIFSSHQTAIYSYHRKPEKN